MRTSFSHLTSELEARSLNSYRRHVSQQNQEMLMGFPSNKRPYQPTSPELRYSGTRRKTQVRDSRDTLDSNGRPSQSDLPSFTQARTLSSNPADPHCLYPIPSSQPVSGASDPTQHLLPPTPRQAMLHSDYAGYALLREYERKINRKADEIKSLCCRNDELLRAHSQSQN
jgi:hypothetical protein